MSWAPWGTSSSWVPWGTSSSFFLVHEAHGWPLQSMRVALSATLTDGSEAKVMVENESKMVIHDNDTRVVLLEKVRADVPLMLLLLSILCAFNCLETNSSSQFITSPNVASHQMLSVATDNMMWTCGEV